MNWCFAIVNGKLSEIHFEKGKQPKVFGHCYVQPSEYKTKKEKNWIKEDIKRFRFTYKKGKYKEVAISKTKTPTS
ncbi:MAG: hypothetical protein P4L74_04315 [Candidatus Doudnabacteria bacterium]|nr:hypothetical protein [Candidatus Doudnabacteria bacterium]